MRNLSILLVWTAGLLLALQHVSAQNHTLDLPHPPLQGTVGKPLAKPVRVYIASPGNSQQTCEKLQLAFDASGSGTASPQVAHARWQNGQCFGQTVWTLAETTGTQELVTILRTAKGTSVPSNKLFISALAKVTAPTPTIKSVGGPYTGLPSTFLPGVVQVEIDTHAEPCSTYSVAFTPMGDGEVKPATTPAHMESGKCMATTAWKLPSAALRPVLMARLKGKGFTGPIHTIDANLIIVTDINFMIKIDDTYVIDDKKDWGYISRDFERPLMVQVDLDHEVHCELLEVEFQPDGDGVASPAKVRGISNGANTKSRQCLFRTRWKLGSIPGEQEVRASLVGHPRTTKSYVGIVRVKPRFVASLVAIPNGVEPPQTDSLGNRIGLPAKQELAPIFGVDFPVAGIFPRSFVKKRRWLHQLRLTVGTGVEHPADALYLGINFMPIIYGVKSEDTPVNIIAGYRWQKGGDNRVWFGASFDAASSIQALVGTIGL